MKKKLLSLLLLTVVALGSFAGCDGLKKNSSTSVDSSTVESSSSVPEIEKIDYVSQLKLDMATETIKQEVTVKTYIDGDTTHFFPKGSTANMPTIVQDDGFLKARYAAVNTPESTGTIEKWGKRASDFTKAQLETAKNGGSIILETEGMEWEADSTKKRFLVWVWYKPAGATEYRNLNLELLQEGLAVGSKAGTSRYGELCNKAISQAKALSLHVYSKDKDPDYFEGQVPEIDLKTLRTNIDSYVNKRVAFEGTVTTYSDWNIYVEDYDDATQMYYGITAFYGYNGALHSHLAPGNRVRIVGNLTYSENFGYQISNLKYDEFEPDSADNVQNLGGGHAPANQEVTIDEFFSKVEVETEVKNPETEEIELVTKEFTYAELAYSTSVCMKNLKVTRAYTTNNGGDNDGAISLTCTSGGKEITIRVHAIKDSNGEMVFIEDDLVGKTIDATGIVEAFNGEYQIKVFLEENLIIH
ncbi:MAG: thermonuclease family protein [Clostridia bacterium]|nr:thermonuclease family protein [Clostridia bacterium]